MKEKENKVVELSAEELAQVSGGVLTPYTRIPDKDNYTCDSHTFIPGMPCAGCTNCLNDEGDGFSYCLISSAAMRKTNYHRD